MITLHESDITSFPHDNGIGVLRDVIRAYAEEELNGLFEFYMEYDSEGHLVDELKEERIIKAKAQDKLGYQLFRIYSITKNHENDNLIVRAQHITYDLADNFVEKLEANNLTKKQVMELIGSSTVLPHPFNITSSNTTTRSSTKLYRTNPLQMIGGIEGSVLQIWGGQIERDNFNLILHDRRGSDDGVKVTYEKNITGLEATFDISGLVTRIFPFVYIEATDNEPSRLITVSGKYIDSPHINDYEKIYIKPIDYSHDERINLDGTDTQIRQQLTNIASQYFTDTGNDKIKVDMDVKFEHLWETEEYKDLAVLELVGLGDTVTINHSKLKVDATAVVNYIRYDCIAEKNEEVRLGSVKARLTDSVNKVVDVAEKAERAQQTANQAIRTANGKNTIYYGPDEPEGGIKGDLWFRVVDGEYTRTYRHDGIQWQLVLSVDVRDAVNEAQQAKDDAQQAVERANQATQQATNAINQAQIAFDEAQQALSTANNALTQATSAFSLANDAFNEVESLSTMVDENTGEISTIKQSVIGLQTRVSDSEGNISNLTQIAQGLQSQVSDIEGNVSTLQQTAQGLQSSVTNLQYELDNLEIGGRNLVGNFNLYPWGHGAGVINKFSTTLSYVVKLERHANYIAHRKTTDYNNRFWFIFVDKDTDDPEDLIGESGTIRFSDNNALSYSFNSENYNWLVIYLTNQKNVDDVEKALVKLEKGNKATDWTPAPEDIDHQFSTITQTIDSIATRVGDAEGNITALQQTSSSLAARLTDAEGNITTLTATVSGLQTTVSNVQGDVSSVTQLASALQVRMTNAEGDISTLTQTASSLQSTISSLQTELDELEIGGTNLHRDSNNFNYDVWDMYDNGSLIVTENVTVEEWEATDATQVYAGAGNRTTILKAYKNLTKTTKTVVGEIYTVSVYVKNVRTDYPMAVRINGITPIPVITLEPGEAKRIVATGERTTNELQIQIRSYSNNHYAEFIIWRAKVEKGNKATDWSPAPEDMATQSQITQLSDAINLRVQKGDVINQINISDESILIDGRKIHITGQTTIDNGVIKSAHIQSLDAGKITTGTLDAGKVTLINLVGLDIYGSRFRSESGTDFMEITGGNIRLQQANGRYVTMMPEGIYGYYAAGTTMFQADRNLVTSQAFGTTEQNVYLAAFNEIRAVNYNDVPGDGQIGSYRYLPIRANGIYANFINVNSGGTGGQHVYLRPRADGEVRCTVNETTDSYVPIKALGFIGDTLDIHPDTASNNLYIRPRAGYEVRFTSTGSTTAYQSVRGYRAFFDGVGVNSGNNLYLGANNEVYVTSLGMADVDPIVWRPLRALGVHANYIDTNGATNATHIYVRPAANGEARVTVRGETDTYRPIRASSFNEASSRDYKTNIEKYTESALDVINGLTVVTYNLINDLENGILEKKIGFISEDSPAIATADGKAIQTYQLSAYNTKAIQELDMKFTNLEDKVNWLEIENQYLKQKVKQLEEMIA